MFDIYLNLRDGGARYCIALIYHPVTKGTRGTIVYSNQYTVFGFSIVSGYHASGLSTISTAIKGGQRSFNPLRVAI